MANVICKDCIHSSKPFEVADHIVVECRFAPPTVNGFPVITLDSFCSNGDDGIIEESAPTEQDMKDYITYSDTDGSAVTLHIPTLLGSMHKKVKYLEQELEILKRTR